MRILLLSIPFIAAAGCSSSAPTTSPDDAGSGSDVSTGLDAASDHDAKNADAAIDAPSDGPTIITQPAIPGDVFAIDQVFLGDCDRQNQASTTAWKSIGRDVDGLTTTSSSTNVCTLSSGAPLTTQIDGNAGIDNSWGSNVLPMLQSITADATPSADATSAILSGAPTLLVQVVGLTSSATQTATGLTAQVFVTVPNPQPPPFDTSASFGVDATCLTDHSTLAGGAIASFGAASITNGTFTSGPASGALVVDAGLGQGSFPLVLRDAVVSFDHVDQDDLVNGTISGVLDTNEFLAALQAQAVRMFGPSLCSGSTWDGIAQQIAQFQDIMNDGSNSTGKTCNAISIGIGFSAKRVKNPDTVVTLPAAPKPCP